MTFEEVKIGDILLFAEKYEDSNCWWLELVIAINNAMIAVPAFNTYVLTSYAGNTSGKIGRLYQIDFKEYDIVKVC